MHSKGESLKEEEHVEDLLPASRFLLENRAIEERGTKALKEQMELSVKMQKKALEELTTILESMKSTDDRMAIHLQKMADANTMLKAHYEWIKAMESVDIRISGNTNNPSKIPVAVVQFSERRIVKGYMDYGSGDFEKSNEVIMTFDPRDVDDSIECKSDETTDRNESSNFSLTDSSAARCSACEFEQMENKLRCSGCGNESEKSGEERSTTATVLTSSVLPSDDESMRSSTSDTSSTSGANSDADTSRETM